MLDAGPGLVLRRAQSVMRSSRLRSPKPRLTNTAIKLDQSSGGLSRSKAARTPGFKLPAASILRINSR